MVLNLIKQKKMIYLHLNGNDAGNSNKGINFGSLSDQKNPHEKFTRKDYYGNLLKWTMFHSEPLEKDEAIEVIASLKENGHQIIATDFRVENHEDGLEIKKLFKNYYFLADRIPQQPIHGKTKVLKRENVFIGGDEDKYYLSCKVYLIGSGQIDSYDDDNNGEGYSLFEAKVKADILHDLQSVDGYLNGTAVNVYSYDGNLILEN